MLFSKIVTVLALAISAEAAAIAARMNSTPDVTTPNQLFKRGESELFVHGSGGDRSASGGDALEVSVSCGTIKAANIEGATNFCGVTLTGAFSGCDGCEWTGVFPTFSLTVSSKCGNAGIYASISSAGEGQGDIGEATTERDCNNKYAGSTSYINVCAGSDWSLVRC